MRVLITGSNGQLGRDLARFCADSDDDVLNYPRPSLDVTDESQVRRIVGDLQPEIVFNCAAWTAVDACEADPERADLVNGVAVGHLAAATSDVGAHLVQVSTDYVFDGTKVGPYLESDETNPQSVYGSSKLSGEQLAGLDASIVRTSWVYSKHGGNMVATLCRLMDSHDTVDFVDDQFGRPTYTGDLARALRSIAVDRATGLFHCSNAGSCSWFEFAQKVYAAAGQDPNRVRPIASAQLTPPRPAPRPANSVLATSKFDAAFAPLPDYRDGLAQVVESYRNA